MTKFKPRCGFLGCDPVVGRCLGFCDKPEMPIQFVETASVEDDDEKPSIFIIGLLLTAAAVGLGFVIGRFW